VGFFLVVFVVALAVPLFGAIGFAGAVVAVSRGLPSIARLERQPQAQDTVLYDASGRVIATLHGADDRVVVPSAAIPQTLKDATVAVEDKRFYVHHGVDFIAVARALIADALAGHFVQGASTITEQYVKNAYLAGGADTLQLKMHEAVLAWELEDRWSKDRILTAYLNTVYYGQGAYGVQAAAQTFFHTDVSRLTLPQAALLAGLPQDPSGYSPIYDPTDALARRDVVLSDMAAQGYITSSQAAAARAAPLRVYRTTPPGVLPAAAWFVDYATAQLVARYGAAETFAGGLRVTTTLDLRLQGDAAAAMRQTLPPGPAGALVSIDPRTGFIRAMTTTQDARRVSFDLAFQAHRQLGSAMKPFALAAAIEQGADPATTYYDSRPLAIPLPGGQVWQVSTFSHAYAGPINLVQATWASDNTVYAQLALDVGPANIVRLAHAAGIQSPLAPYPSIVLGSEAVTPLEVADAYATFADLGVRHAPQAIARVVFPDGKVSRARVKGVRAMPAGVVYVVDQILAGNTRYGTAAAMPNYYSGVAAGKTGTTENSADAWFAGFDPLLATAVWMGYPQAEIPMPGVQGATYCVPIWGRYYEMVFGAAAVPDFAVPAQLPHYRPWTGAYAVGAPAPSASPGAPSPGASATPAPTTAGPTPQPTATATAQPSPSPT
jgi:penicillin-binding protein 1A